MSTGNINMMDDVRHEVESATRLYKTLNSAHEAYAVILEELDEFWEEVRKKRENRNKVQMRKELIQIAAMACRFVGGY